MIAISNNGPEILETNYWDSELASKGLVFISVNAGALRVLFPKSEEKHLLDVQAAHHCIFSVGPWPDIGVDQAIEVLFEDGSDAPFALFLTINSIDRLPSPLAFCEHRTLSVWTEGPKKVFETKCYIRSVDKIPCLLPLQSK